MTAVETANLEIRCSRPRCSHLPSQHPLMPDSFNLGLGPACAVDGCECIGYVPRTPPAVTKARKRRRGAA
jgi:hypothetical protein